MRTPDSRQHWWTAIGGMLLTLLLAAVFTLGSLDLPFEPQGWREVIALYAVSSFITAALLVFGLILTRSVLRLWAERSKEQLGARFKTKMVVGAMAISLLPVIFMFFVSYSLLNRTLGRWFPRPLEIAAEQSGLLLGELERIELPRLENLAREAQVYSKGNTDEFLDHAFRAGADAAWILTPSGVVARGGVVCETQSDDRTGKICWQNNVNGKSVHYLPNGIELWAGAGNYYLASRVPSMDRESLTGYVVAGKRTTPNFLKRDTEIETQSLAYGQEKQHLRALKRQMLLILFFFTLLVLFAAMWVALFLAVMSGIQYFVNYARQGYK